VARFIDMRRLSRSPPTPFPHVQTVSPFEVVVSAALLGGKNCGRGVQIVFRIFTTII
jgi:hypothetical protein